VPGRTEHADSGVEDDLCSKAPHSGDSHSLRTQYAFLRRPGKVVRSIAPLESSSSKCVPGLGVRPEALGDSLAHGVSGPRVVSHVAY
jgi:hypothetical protein